MTEKLQHIPVKQLCDVIDLLHACMDDYLYVYDFKNDFYYISPHAVKRFALSENHFTDVFENHQKFVYHADIDDLEKELNELISGEREFHNMQYRWLDKEGQPVWINCRGYVVRDNANPPYMLGCINEIGVKQKADNVSGLLGETSLQSYLHDFSSYFPNGYILRLGIDDFKEINEKLGIEYGDMVLRQTAKCISEHILPGQKLYRVLTDEFILLDFIGGSTQDAKTQYRNIRRSLDRFIAENNYEAVFTISGGILDCRDLDDYSYSSVMKLSEFALHEAKRKGKNRCIPFNLEDYQKFLHKLELTQNLRKAVSNNFIGFEAYFQPIIRSELNELAGAEALMRFKDSDGKMVSPAEFIPILEETSLIIPVGRWMLHTVLKACKEIHKFFPTFTVSMNLSYVQIIKSDISNEILTAVEEYDISPEQIIVELTESGFLESDSYFSRMWNKLKDKGIRIALDDFGTGYSNFHYLQKLRPHIIKIDRSFTAKALENEYEYNLLSLMSDLVHNLNLKICIEGIETEEERLHLQQLSPDFSQGYHFGKPCSLDVFMDTFINQK